MRSWSPRSDLDLEHGVPTTPADIEAQRRIRGSRRLSTEEYLRALTLLPPRSREAVTSRKWARAADPFRLP